MWLSFDLALAREVECFLICHDCGGSASGAWMSTNTQMIMEVMIRTAPAPAGILSVRRKLVERSAVLCIRMERRIGLLLSVSSNQKIPSVMHPSALLSFLLVTTTFAKSAPKNNPFSLPIARRFNATGTSKLIQIDQARAKHFKSKCQIPKLPDRFKVETFT